MKRSTKIILVFCLFAALLSLSCGIYPEDGEGGLGTHFSHGVGAETDLVIDAVEAQESEGSGNSTNE